MTDDNASCFAIGYAAYYDGYTIGCMSETYNPTQNKHYVRGWLEAKREDQ